MQGGLPLLVGSGGASSTVQNPITTAITDFKAVAFVEGVILLVFCLVLARFIPRLVARIMRGARVDIQVTLLTRRLTMLAFIALGILGFFSVWLKSPSVVFGSFGVFALAFGLAFQDILKNFLAGIFLLLERPFRIGDEITVDTNTGTVDNIEIRTTTLRTADGQEVLIPNSSVYTGTVINRTRYPTRQFTLTAKVPAGVSLTNLTEAVRSRLLASDEVAKEPPPSVGFQPSIDGGVTLEARYWLEYRRHDPLKVQAALGQQIFQVIQSQDATPDGAGETAPEADSADHHKGHRPVRKKAG